MANYTTENLVPAIPTPGVPAIRIGDQVFTMTAGGTDVSDTTATAATVLGGYEFYNSAGVKTSGTIPTVSASLSANVTTVPAGYIAASQTLTVPVASSATVSGNVVTIPSGYVENQVQVTVGSAVSAQTITPTTSNQVISSGVYLGGNQTILGDVNLTAANIASGVTIFGVTGSHHGGADVSDTTATAADVLSGKYFYASNGIKTSGTIPTVTASSSGNVVTVPAGYIASSQTVTVDEAGAASVSGNVVTIPVGYIASQRTVTVGTAVAAQTITPGTTDQTIASGSYLTGAATIKGDANLVASNIADGVSIFGVNGTYKGDGMDDLEFFDWFTILNNQ